MASTSSRLSLKQRVAAGEALGAFWLSLGSATIAELAIPSRPDLMVIDLQHGLWERRELEHAVGLVRQSMPVIARVAENSAFAIGSALDAGVNGVLVPMVETAEQAQAAVAAARFPPRGIRSGGGVRPLAMGFANYLAQADDLFVGIMVETVAGAANAARIAATAGLDMIFIGSGDLMLSCAANGIPGDVDSMCQSIKAVSHTAGVACGMFTADAQAACRARRNGFRMVVTANDIDLVTKGWNSASLEWGHTDDG